MFSETEISLRNKKILSITLSFAEYRPLSKQDGDWRGSVIQVASIDAQITFSGLVKNIVEENLMESVM